ncbi:MAG: hypothetical protein ACO3QK_07845 [Flavobacteriaceae bacterium]
MELAMVHVLLCVFWQCQRLPYGFLETGKVALTHAHCEFSFDPIINYVSDLEERIVSAD